MTVPVPFLRACLKESAAENMRFAAAIVETVAGEFGARRPTLGRLKAEPLRESL